MRKDLATLVEGESLFNDGTAIVVFNLMLAAAVAAVGAGAGAGSVYVQGRNDLDLSSGTEVTVRASAPRTNGIAADTTP